MEKHTLVLSDGRTLSSGGGGMSVRHVKLTRSVNSGATLTVGSVCSAVAEIDIIDTGSTCPVKAGEDFCLLGEDGEKLGRFTVETPTRTAPGCYRLLAYDPVAKLDQNVDQWLSGLSDWPYSLGEFVKMVCAQCGVTLAPGELPRSAFPVKQLKTTNLTGRQLISWAAQIMGRFVRADAEGFLSFSWYAPAHQAIGPEDYFAGSLKYADMTIAPVEQVVLENGEERVCYPDHGENKLIIRENPYISTYDQMLSVAKHLYTQLQELPYTPCSLTVEAGRFCPGDILHVTDSRGRHLQMPVMTILRLRLR